MLFPVYQLNSGFKFPSIGLGTFNCYNDDELETAVDTALETGYRHIDTAYFYQNEHVIGRVLKRWFDAGKLKREDLFVTTKLPGCQTPEKVEFYIKDSLKGLQLEYVDLYLIHFPMGMILESNSFYTAEGGPSDIVATWKKMEEQVDAGRAKSIGISNFNVEQTQRILNAARIPPAANQFEHHIYLQQPELVNFLKQNNIQVISYQTFGNPGLPALYEKRRNIKLENYPTLLNDPTAKVIADKYGKSVSHVLLRHLIQKGIAVIPKSVTPNRIKENFNIWDFKLDDADVKILDSLDKGSPLGRNVWFDQKESYVNHPEHPFGRNPLKK